MDKVERITQAYSQAPWRMQKQLLGLFLLGVVFVALIAGIYLSVTARATTVGRKIQKTQSAIQLITKDNSHLQSLLAQLNSEAVMRTRAEAIGFVDITTEETVFIRVEGYPGRTPIILAPSESPTVVVAAALPAQYTESLFEWMTREVDLTSLRSLLKVRP